MTTPRMHRLNVKTSLKGHVAFLENRIRDAVSHRFDASVVILGLRAQEAPLGPVVVTDAGELEFRQLEVTVTDELESLFDEHRAAEALCELMTPGSRAARLRERIEFMELVHDASLSEEAALEEIEARL